MTNSFEQTPAVLTDIASQLPPEYSLLEFLGEGGHGIVLKAINRALQKEVALKIIKTDLSDEMQKRVSRMQNEAKILAKLQHKNIVRVFQMGACLDGTPFLVCEYLEGITLAQYLKSKSQLSPSQLLEVFCQTLDALSCAHENGLLHRDIKPSNIMIMTDSQTKNLEVKLLDFGIARDLESMESKPLGLTRTIQISGSAPYMSPEQCKGERIDNRSDLYSVGCMLYECLSGTPPFQGETPMHTRYLQIHEQAQIPEDDKFAHTSSRSAVYKLCMQALAKDPAQRPQSAAEFEAALRKALPMAAERSSWSTKQSLLSKHWKIMLAAVSLLVVSGAVLFLAQRQQATKSVNLEHRHSQPGRTLRPHSKLVVLKELFNRHIRYTYHQTPASMAEGLRLLADLDKLISSLEAGETGTAFSAYKIRAELENNLGFLEIAQRDWLKTLSYCQTKDHKPTFEAVDCYASLSEIARRNGDLSAAETLAKKGLDAAKESGGPAENYLDLPAIIDFRSADTIARCYKSLAETFQARSMRKEALQYRILQEQTERSTWGLKKSSETLLSVAMLLEESGEKNRALKLIRERAKELRELPSNEADLDDIVALSAIGRWFHIRNYKQDALLSLKLALQYATEQRKPENSERLEREICEINSSAP